MAQEIFSFILPLLLLLLLEDKESFNAERTDPITWPYFRPAKSNQCIEALFRVCFSTIMPFTYVFQVISSFNVFWL